MPSSEVSEAPARASAISRIEWAMDAAEAAGASQTAAHVLLVLARYANTDYGATFVGVLKIASKARLLALEPVNETPEHRKRRGASGKRRAFRALKELNELGLVEEVQQREDETSIRVLAGAKSAWKLAVSTDTHVTTGVTPVSVGDDSPVIPVVTPVSPRTILEEPTNEPVSSPSAQKLERENPLSLATTKQVGLVGKLLKEKGITFQELQSAWGRIPGLSSETPPTSFDSFNADDVSVVFDWLKGKGKQQEQQVHQGHPVSRVIQEPPGEPAGEAFEWVAQDALCAETWTETLALLKGKVTGPIFKSQLEDTQGWAREGDDFIVVCRNDYSIRRLRGDMETMMRDALLRASGGEVLTLKLVAKGDSE